MNKNDNDIQTRIDRSLFMTFAKGKKKIVFLMNFQDFFFACFYKSFSLEKRTRKRKNENIVSAKDMARLIPSEDEIKSRITSFR